MRRRALPVARPALATAAAAVLVGLSAPAAAAWLPSGPPPDAESSPASGAWPAVPLVAGGDTVDAPREAGEEEEPPADLAELRPVFEEAPLEAVPQLLRGASARGDPAEENRWIELARLLRGMDEEAAREAGLAAVEEEAGDPGAAVARLEAALDGDSGESAPALAALAALIADGSADLDGSPFRTLLVEEYLDSPEGPEAALLLAGSLASQGGEARGEALELLEALVVTRPGHALAPDARRLIEVIQ